MSKVLNLSDLEVIESKNADSEAFFKDYADCVFFTNKALKCDHCGNLVYGAMEIKPSLQEPSKFACINCSCNLKLISDIFDKRPELDYVKIRYIWNYKYYLIMTGRGHEINEPHNEHEEYSTLF